MHSFRFSTFFALSAAALSAHGTPPAAAEETVALGHVVITAHPYGRNQAEIAQPSNVLAGQALALRQANSLGELLSGEPGISSSYFGPGASRPIVRGLSGERVRLLENGTATIDASVTSPDHAVALDPLLIERVEVIRGPATLLHGNAAVGGVVNVISHRIHTASPDSSLNGRIETRLGSAANERASGLILEGGAGPVAWHVDAYRREARDLRIPGDARSASWHAERFEEGNEQPGSFGRIPNTAFAADGAAIGLSWIGTRGYLGASFNGHNTLYGIPSGAHLHIHEEPEGSEHDHAHEEEDHPEEEYVGIDLRQRRLEFQGELRAPFAGLTALRYKVGAARYRHLELQGDEVGTAYSHRGHDARIEALHAPFGHFNGSFGIQTSRSRLTAEGAEAFLPPNDALTHALFVFEEADFSPVRWQFGTRMEDRSLRLEDGSRIRSSDTTFSFSTGAIWMPGESWSVSVSAVRSERSPNAQELFSRGPHLGTNAYELGNPELGPERSLAVDLSLRKRTGFVTGALTVFAQRFNGFIFESPTGEVRDDLDVYAYVQRDARFVGAELEAIFHLHEGTRHQLDFHLDGDLVHGREHRGSHLPRIAPRRARLGFVWNAGPYTFGADLRLVDAQHRLAINERGTDGYTLLNAHTSYRFSSGRARCELFMQANNLADEEGRVHTSFLKDVAPLPGRNVVAGVRLSF